jgi:DnaA family protein
VLLDDVHLYTAVQQHAAFNWFVNAADRSGARVRAGRGRLPPGRLPLREDLRTRLGWGHVFQLQALTEPSAAPCCARRPTRAASSCPTR